MKGILQTVLYEQEMDLDFMDKVHSIPGGGAIKRCIQCGTCSGTCPVSWAMEESPRQIIAMVRAGWREKVLASSTIWTCASCYSCSVRCPQEIKITDVMYILKRLAIREGRKGGRKVQAFSRTFVDLVNEYGRNHEFALVRKYLMSTRLLGSVKEGNIGIALRTRGRLPLTASSIKDLDGLRKIVAKAMELGGEE